MQASKKYQYELVTIFFLVWGFVFLDRLIVAYLAPIIKPILDINDGQVAMINSVMTATFALSSVVVGYFSDRIGKRKPFLVGCVFGVALFSVLTTMVQSYGWLLFFRACSGACGGPVFTLMMAILGNASEDNFGANSGIASCGSSIIGSMLGPLVAVYLAEHVSWQSAFLANAMPTIICALLIWRFAKDAKVDLTTQEESETNIFRVFVELLKYRNAVICMCISVFGMAGFWAVMMFGPTYWVDSAGQTPEAMSSIIAIMGVVGMVQIILIPKLSDIFGRRPIMIWSYALSALVPLSMYFMGSSWLNIGVFIALAGISGAMMPLFMSVVPSETVPPRLFATGSGIILALGEFIGGSVFLIIGGYIADHFGIMQVMLVGFILFAITTAFSFALTESNSRILREQTAKVAAEQG